MFHDQTVFTDAPEPGMLVAFDARWPGLRRRFGGLAIALALEAVLLLLLLTLGQGITGSKAPADALTTVDFTPEEVPADTPEQPEKQAKPTALPRSRPSPQPDRPTPPIPLPPTPPPAAVLSPKVEQAPALETPKIKAVIRDDAGGPAGPAYRAAAGDSQLVGTGPHGEPVYAARWYREPYPDELRGYLSTASGPGYALINCRTIADFKVDSCVLVDEYPDNAGLGRAVLAAAWQFKVRPPQVGGRVMVGEWVRIRITYDLKRG